MRTKTHPFDPAEHLATVEAQAEYISAALEIDDPTFIAWHHRAKALRLRRKRSFAVVRWMTQRPRRLLPQ